MFKIVIDTCIDQLKSILDRETMEDCYIDIEYRREGRHQKTLKKHLSKLERMCHKNTGGCSNLQHGIHDENCHLNTNTCMKNAIDTGTTTSDQRSNNILSDNTSNNNNNNWVRNYSKIPLTEPQQHLLSHGPNFVITPRDPPTLDYLVATKKACNQLTQGKAEELRGAIKAWLRKDHKAKPNIPKDEYQALREMKKDNTRQVLTADKGVSMVVLDSEDYTAKSEALLHQPNYNVLKTDPPNKYKNKLFGLLKTIKAEGGMDDIT